MKKWIFLFLLFPLMCLAQTYQYLGVEDGLSNRRVYYIQKDSVGYMWFLTHEGIDRFNGKEFKRYQLMDGNQEVNSLLNFSWLYIDKEGTLWEVGRKGRIFRYDRLRDHFELVYKLPENSEQQIPSLISYSWIDKANNIWLCNEDSLYFYSIPTQKVSKIKNGIGEVITNVKQMDQTHFFVGTEKGVHYAQLNKQTQSLTSLKKLTSGMLPINELYFDGKTGKLFIGTFQQGILIYDSHTQKIIQPQHFLSDTNVSRIKPLNEKELLIATDGTGIYKINTDTYQIEPYIVADYNRYNEMNGNSINDIYIDDEKRIWMANYPIGITIRNNQYSSYTWIKHSIGNKQSLLNDQVNSIIEDSDGDLWFGTNNGISHLDNKTGIWNSYLSNFEQARKNKNQIFTTLCEVAPGIIWAGGYSPYIYQINKASRAIEFITPNKFANANVRSDKYIQKILKDSQGDIWIGGYYNLQRINFQNKETHVYDGLSSITTMIEKNDKEMWIGCATGVYLLDKRTGKFERIKLPEESTYIYSLYADKTGLLYIGTSGSGLFIYSPQTKLFANYNTDNCTLISNNIYTILSANDNEILISTESGLTSFYPDQKIFHHWTKEMGLTSTQFNAVSGILRKNNNFIFGSNNGAVEFNKNRKLPHLYSSKMIFSDFKLFYQTIYPGSADSPLTKDINETKLLELKYNQNIFSIQVSSINYDYPTNILYSWKLEGFYEEWSKPSTENTIRYTNLAPGKYTLFVRAVSNEDKRVILEERSIDIIVAQPFWLSFWAILIYAIIVILIAITALRIYILRKQRKASDEKINFFINTAHDIRTPLTLIKAPLEEMQEKEELSKEAVVNMNTALRNVNALLRLTTNLINFERANIYSSELYVSEQELNTFMTGIFNVFMPYAKVKHISFTYESNFRYSNV
ncbi:MAG TPA: hybrid sensor histidine kinase/response regulator, partial [Bacteroides reticulotermitis]|nr:hybrid sensor histidine kinase/response regulator [Bacteroides reticulotermitis]